MQKFETIFKSFGQIPGLTSWASQNYPTDMESFVNLAPESDQNDYIMGSANRVQSVEKVYDDINFNELSW